MSNNKNDLCMKRILSVALFVMLSFVMMGQSAESLTVRFRGQLNGSMYQRLDSVTVTNTVRGWSETVIYPDTIIVLNLMVNVPEKEISAAGFEQNVPNPFDCHTMVELSIPQDEKVCLQLYDELGKLCSELNVNLLAGSHSFEISASKPQMYILKAVAGAKTYSVRMLNVGRGGSDGIQYNGYAGLTAKLYSENEFVLGDNIQYVGYATIDGNFVESRTINQGLYINQEVILQFTYYSSASVETLAATEITRTSARLNASITDDGGSEITARGFHYGLSPDNLDNEVVSSSTGMNFSEQVGALEMNTTYYYMAYATNGNGTSNGNVMSFTTANESELAGTLNGHDWVDLGFPSGTRWATCNVGANSPEDFGDYFAWGETEPKLSFYWSNYRYSATGASYDDPRLTKYCNDSQYGNMGFTDDLTVLEPSDDAATVNWGAGWMMPTHDEINELYAYCHITCATQNGVNGRLFTGPNGNSIFIPAACIYANNTYCNDFDFGDIWSRSLDVDNSSYAWHFNFSMEDYDYHISNYLRCWGRSVRPVCR